MLTSVIYSVAKRVCCHRSNHLLQAYFGVIHACVKCSMKYWVMIKSISYNIVEISIDRWMDIYL